MAIRKKINFMPCRWFKKGAFVTCKNQFFDKLMKMSLFVKLQTIFDCETFNNREHFGSIPTVSFVLMNYITVKDTFQTSKPQSRN